MPAVYFECMSFGFPFMQLAFHFLFIAFLLHLHFNYFGMLCLFVYCFLRVVHFLAFIFNYFNPAIRLVDFCTQGPGSYMVAREFANVLLDFSTSANLQDAGDDGGDHLVG
jgi:hypothetical protein